MSPHSSTGNGDEQRPIPRALAVVAWLFMAEGVLAAAHILIALVSFSILLDFDVLGMWVGPGLLAGDPRRYRWAIRLTWIFVAVVPLGFIIFMSAPGPFTFYAFGAATATIPRAIALLFIGGLFCLELWKLRILYRADVRAWFKKGEGHGPGSQGPLPIPPIGAQRE